MCPDAVSYYSSCIRVVKADRKRERGKNLNIKTHSCSHPVQRVHSLPAERDGGLGQVSWGSSPPTTPPTRNHCPCKVLPFLKSENRVSHLGVEVGTEWASLMCPQKRLQTSQCAKAGGVTVATEEDSEAVPGLSVKDPGSSGQRLSRDGGKHVLYLPSSVEVSFVIYHKPGYYVSNFRN